MPAGAISSSLEQEKAKMLAVKIIYPRILIQKFNTDSMSFVSQKSFDDLPKGYEMEMITGLNDLIFFVSPYVGLSSSGCKVPKILSHMIKIPPWFLSRYFKLTP